MNIIDLYTQAELYDFDSTLQLVLHTISEHFAIQHVPMKPKETLEWFKKQVKEMWQIALEQDQSYDRNTFVEEVLEEYFPKIIKPQLQNDENKNRLRQIITKCTYN